jgi:hypothetical protein
MGNDTALGEEHGIQTRDVAEPPHDARGGFKVYTHNVCVCVRVCVCVCVCVCVHILCIYLS